MVNRRVGRPKRLAQKRKQKVAKVVERKRAVDVGHDERHATTATASILRRAKKSSGSAAVGTSSSAPPDSRRSMKKALLSQKIASQKQRSVLLKAHAKERMVLKHHVRELEARAQRLRKGENCKVERRELRKYIRQLQEEQAGKHKQQLTDVNSMIEQVRQAQRTKGVDPELLGGRRGTRRHGGGAMDDEEWEDMSSDSSASGDDYDADEAARANPAQEAELRAMFAHLTM